jgi:succinylarginine dihydrolase
MVDDAKLDRLAEVIRRTWPVEIDNADLRKASLIRDVEAARAALLETLELGSLA